MILPISAIIPTRNRPVTLRQTLESLARATAQPAEVILMDASSGKPPRLAAKDLGLRETRLVHRRTKIASAARQRNQAMPFARQPYILFCDDDVVFRPKCLQQLYQTISSQERLGGVNALIENQKYRPPGRWGTFIFRLLDERKLDDYAGRVIGPAVNFLPADEEKAPVETEWLNTTCVLYRREALPNPPFPRVFRGYSLCEDLALSLLVGRQWRLANNPRARIVHKSVPGSHKSNPSTLARMEVLHRHYVMTEILGRRRPRHYAQLLLWELFNSAAVSAQSHRSVRAIYREIQGKLRAAVILAKGGIS